MSIKFAPDYNNVPSDERLIPSKFAYQPCEDGWIDCVPEGWEAAKFQTERMAQRVADKLGSKEGWQVGLKTQHNRCWWRVVRQRVGSKWDREVVCVKDYDSPVYDD
tara:strand:+ start:627 stop:944 length:318 start_codon:yes stop_codon:yes gene_type:complete